VAPEMISHYVDVHRYRPADVFISAVLDCPLPGTAECARAVPLEKSTWARTAVNRPMTLSARWRFPQLITKGVSHTRPRMSSR
jgi:hypothetical protein